jgi:HK97 family phage portal protein
MNFMDRLPRPKAALSGAIERLILDTYGSYSTSSGVSVNSDTAMRLITFHNCVRLRAATLSRLPCHIMEKSGKEKNKAEDFYLYDKLLNQPNSWMSAPEFWGMAEAHVSTRGNFIAYKAQLPGRPIRELIPIRPGALESITQNDDYSLDYAVRMKKTGEVVHLNGSQVFHLRGMTMDGITGMNPVEYAREAIGKGLASEKHLGKWFSKGLHPSAVIRHPLALNAQAYANAKANLKEKYQGLGQDYEFMFLDEAMEIEFPTIKLVDAQFLEQMKLTEAQICGLCRVPLMLVAAGDKAATFASSEQFMLFYMMLSIDAPNYESAIRRDLFTEDEKKKYFAKFEMRGLLRGAFKDQMDGMQTAINAEIMNPNEARDVLDMNPYDGGDEYRTRTSTIKEPAKPADQGGAQP